MTSAAATFDVSILKLHDGIFEVIATNGDTHLGGDDFDNLLLATALDDIRGDMGLDLRTNPSAVQALRRAVIEVKHTFVISMKKRILMWNCPAINAISAHCIAGCSRKLIESALDRTVGPCKQALLDAGLKPEQIEEVVLVGGSTRIPIVRAAWSKNCSAASRTAISTQMRVVALGAAVQADILSGGSISTENMFTARRYTALTRH